MTGIVVAGLIVVFVAVAVILTVLHQPTPRPARPAPTSSGPSAAVVRIRSAANAADAATTTALTELHSLRTLPTPATVQAAMDPYISSLQHFRTVLAATAAPAAARKAAAGAHALVTRDVRFFSTIHGLPPLQLGAYLVELSRDASQLQQNLANLQRELRPAR